MEDETLAVKSNRERIAVIERDMIAALKTLGDHETRLRSRERLEFQILAYCLVGSTIGGAITTIVSILMIR